MGYTNLDDYQMEKLTEAGASGFEWYAYTWLCRYHDADKTGSHPTWTTCDQAAGAAMVRKSRPSFTRAIDGLRAKTFMHEGNPVPVLARIETGHRGQTAIYADNIFAAMKGHAIETEGPDDPKEIRDGSPNDPKGIRDGSPNGAEKGHDLASLTSVENSPGNRKGYQKGYEKGYETVAIGIRDGIPSLDIKGTTELEPPKPPYEGGAAAGAGRVPHPTRTAPARLRESAGFPPELSEWLERQDAATIADYARFRVLHREVVGNPEGTDAALRGMKPRDRKFWRENGERFLEPIAIEAKATA